MRLIIFVFVFQVFMTTAQEIQKNIFGFATSNTFTYCSMKKTTIK